MLWGAVQKICEINAPDSALRTAEIQGPILPLVEYIIYFDDHMTCLKRVLNSDSMAKRSTSLRFYESSMYFLYFILHTVYTVISTSKNCTGTV